MKFKFIPPIIILAGAVGFGSSLVTLLCLVGELLRED